MDTTGGWAVTQDSVANTGQTLTRAASANGRHFITSFEVVISGNAAGADVVCTLSDGGTAIWKTVIGSGAARGERTGLTFSKPVRCGKGNAITLTVSAGGASAVTTANISGYTA